MRFSSFDKQAAFAARISDPPGNRLSLACRLASSKRQPGLITGAQSYRAAGDATSLAAAWLPKGWIVPGKPGANNRFSVRDDEASFEV
jgi:hypothetical protein